MQNRKWYEWLLTFTYFAMIALCAGLNMTSVQKEGTANLIVNGVLFLIVGIIFLNCELHSFAPMNRVIADLTGATEKIRNDAMNAHEFLWEPYKSSGVELFREKQLQDAFQDYVFELNRITDTEKAYYKCDIEDYINAGMVDRVMHRNLLNQVAGVMTGLGILGTFIGLSLGLQHFNTGTTAEVTNSISPLMDGIKVAFHTSIYGMIFSLVFNYAYKRKLDEGENAVEDFINAYKKYVLPDTTTDGINKLMELQQEQVAAIGSMTDRMAKELDRLVEPQFSRMNHTITEFGALATQSQKEALGAVVNEFIREMNRSLGTTFLQLNEMFNRAYNAQQQNGQLIQNVSAQADENRRAIEDVKGQSEMNMQIMSQEQEYLTDLAQYRQSLADASEALKAELDRQAYLMKRQESIMEQQSEMIGELKEMMRQMTTTLASAYDSAEDAWNRTAEAVEDLRDEVGLGDAPVNRRN